MVSIIDHAVPSDMEPPTNSYMFDREVKASQGYNSRLSGSTDR
jgi:hypothetical protein